MSDVDISEIVDSTVTVEDSYPTRRGFKSLMIAAYHRRQSGDARVLSYTRPEEAAEVWPLDHPIYLDVAAAFAGEVTPDVVKVGRREGAPTQTVRLTPVSTVAGFEYSLSIGGVALAVTVQSGDAVADVCDDLVTALAASSLAADDDAILTALATSVSEQSIPASQANGVIGRAVISPPAKLTVTRSAHADQDAVTSVLTYVDDEGVTRTQNLAFANGGGDSFTSTYRARKFVSLVTPAQAGTAGTTKIGVAARVTATDGTTHVDFAADAGAWLPYRLTTKTEDLLFEDRTPNPATTIETDLAAIAAADDDWFGLVLADAQSSAQIVAAAAWAATNKRLALFDTMDSAVVDDSVSTDVMSLALDASYPCAIFYHRGGAGYAPCSRWAGRKLPIEPGTETWALVTLTGLPVDDLTASERTAIKAKSGNFYGRLARRGRMLGAKNGGVLSTGRFIDLERFRLAIDSEIQEELFAALTVDEKLPMDDFGLAKLGGAIRRVCKSKETIGAARLHSTRVTVPLVADIPAGDRADRIASGLEWSVIYASAVHKVRVRGRIGI